MRGWMFRAGRGRELTRVALRAAALAVVIGAWPALAETPRARPGVHTASSPAPRLPRVFVEERAGPDAEPHFVAAGRGVSTVLRTGGPSWVIAAESPDGRRRRARVDLVPVGGRRVEPVGRSNAGGRIHRFRGAPDEWRTNLAAWNSVAYPELWDGIELVVETADDAVKSTFVVSPGADHSSIRLLLDGAESARLDEQGRLVVRTAAGPVVDDAPVAWLDDGTDVPVAFDLQHSDAGIEIGFEVADFDPRRTLHLDPAVVSQAGFLGGDGRDYVTGLAVDTAGNVYICGWTDSTELTFPAQTGPDLTAEGDTGAHGDAFVAKLDPTGTTLLYAGFIGGWESDFANGIAVDAQGRAYVCGHTDCDSDTENFPATVGPDTSFGGSVDGWVARVSSDGSTLEYCGYIGGSGHEDRALGIDVDAQGRAYVAGRTNSTGDTFSETVGPSLTHAGGHDAFVARVRADGMGFEYNGFVGGAGFDELNSIAVGAGGVAYVSGISLSTESSFPVKTGPSLANAGGNDAIVAQVAADGSDLVWAGFLGGAGADLALALDIDAAGNVYVVGWTDSDETTFPVAVGPDLTANGGFSDGFVAKIPPNGAGITWCGFVGGSDRDLLTGVAAEDGGRVWVAGQTFTAHDDPVPPPLLGGPDDTYGGSGDGFVGRVTATGAALDFGGYVGGTGTDAMVELAVLPETQQGTISAWVAGTSTSTEATFPVVSGPDVTHNGSDDVVVLRIDATAAEPPPPTLSIVGKSGKLKDSAKEGKDRFAYKGTLTFGGASPDGVVDPTTDTLTLLIGSEGTEHVLVVPAGDPGWKITKKSIRWKGPGAQVKLTPAKGKLTIKLKKIDFPGPQTAPVHVSFDMGDDSGTSADTWMEKKPGTLKLKK